MKSRKEKSLPLNINPSAWILDNAIITNRLLTFFFVFFNRSFKKKCDNILKETDFFLIKKQIDSIEL